MAEKMSEYSIGTFHFRDTISWYGNAVFTLPYLILGYYRIIWYSVLFYYRDYSESEGNTVFATLLRYSVLILSTIGFRVTVIRYSVFGY